MQADPNKHGVHIKAIEGFKGADLYERSRPSYPDDAVDHLVKNLSLSQCSDPSYKIVEIGPGTGSFTKCLVKRGLFEPSYPTKVEFLAVEPNNEMREMFTQLYPKLHAVDGSAFHWFANLPALREFHRVLRAPGVVTLIWNLEDNSVPWVKQLREYYESYEHGHPQYRTGKWLDVFNEAEAKTLFSPLRRTFFKHSVTSTVEVAVDRVMSRSYLQVLGKEEQQKIREKLKEMFDKVQENGEVTLPLVCEVAVFEKQTVEKSKQ